MTLKKPDILSQIHVEPSVDLPRLRLRSPFGMALVVAPMLMIAAAFALVPQRDIQSETLSSTPLALSVANTEQSDFYSRSERIARGDTTAALINRLGIHDEAALAFIQKNNVNRALSKLPVGSVVHARVDDTGNLQELSFRLDANKELLLQREKDSFVSKEQDLALTTRIETRSGMMSNSLFAALDNADVPDAYARQLIDIFSGEIDFHRGLKRGDRFSLAYEVLVDRYGSEVKSGRLLAASIVNNGEEHKAVAFTLPDGKTEYFTPTGESLKRAFLQNPVEFSRISSGFSGARFHPVLQTMRAHKGVDYAAPIGSKIMATADGKVEFVGVKSGFGNVVILRHNKTYSTVYGHMNGFAKGLRAGSSVQQGQVIGYVGMTGLASGPHLHYEFLVNNQQIDPLSSKVPVTTTLNASQRVAFNAQSQKLEHDLALEAPGANSAAFE